MGKDTDGKDVIRTTVGPSAHGVCEALQTGDRKEHFEERYATVFEGTEEWRKVSVPQGNTYSWDEKSTYIQEPPFFQGVEAGEPPATSDISKARVLALLGDTVTTDHISPAGSIAKDSPAAVYLEAAGVDPHDFNSYGSRRGNHEVMMRGTFANIRIRNEMAPGTEGGVSVHYPSGEQGWVYDVAMRYQAEGTPLVVIAGKEYGTGSSRDWAAKGTNLLGVKAVLAESFERIHRTNLVCMGVLPLQFKNGEGRATYKLDGTEVFDVLGIGNGINPMQDVTVRITRKDGSTEEVIATCRIDTENEVLYYQNGGILQFVLRNMMKAA